MHYSIRPTLTVPERNNFPGKSDLLAHLLFHRGLKSSDEAEKFLAPDYNRDSHDPFLLKDAEKAASRFIQAVKNNERIAIYADYDADGIPGAAMFSDFLNKIQFKNFSIYIPHRHDEGFGVNEEAVDQLVNEGVKLMITIDCGISDYEPIKRAMKKGMDVIVTDHHEAPDKLPPAFCVVDHKQKDCNYPDKNLCGTGVAYKLIQAILKKERFGLKEGIEKWFLDLVGIATMSDMVPLIGENRVFSHYGLMVLKKSPRKGLVQLLSHLKIRQHQLTEDDIAFMITPRINAASRMGVPRDAFDMLTAETDEQAYKCAKHLDEINNERKGVVASLVKDVKHKIKERHPDPENIPGVIVLGNPDWKPSLLGLVANTCAEEYCRPVFLWGRDGDNVIKGSCRGDGSVSLVEIMKSAPANSFLQFGGHYHSGGFAVENDRIHYLENILNDSLLNIRRKEKTSEDADSADYIDLELSVDDLDWNLQNEIAKLGPFGTGNPKPIFLFKNIVVDSFKTFGKGNDHVELGFKKKSGIKIPAISFFGGKLSWANTIKVGQKIDLVASVEKSLFRNIPELRLRVEEVTLK